MKKSLKTVVTAIAFTGFVGTAFIGTIILGYFCGDWVDKHFLIHPLGKAMGILFGAFLASYSIYKHIKENLLK